MKDLVNLGVLEFPSLEGFGRVKLLSGMDLNHYGKKLFFSEFLSEFLIWLQVVVHDDCSLTVKLQEVISIVGRYEVISQEISAVCNLLRSKQPFISITNASNYLNNFMGKKKN